MNTTMVKSQSTITDCEANTMAKRAIEELRGDYRRKVIETLEGLEADVHKFAESPIEELLIWALLDNDSNQFESFVFPSRFVLGGDGDASCLFLTPLGDVPVVHTYILQPSVIACGHRYRLDIALQCGDIESRVYVAIECDGHEFHEKTREQAEADKRRDRDLQSIGWTIARFTGSEIFRDASGAAKAATDLAWAQHELRREAATNALEREKKGGR